MNLSYAQQSLAALRLKEMGHGEALRAFQEGEFGGMDGTLWYGTYHLDGEAAAAQEAARLFGLLGYLVTPARQDDPRFRKGSLAFDVTTPTLPSS